LQTVAAQESQLDERPPPCVQTLWEHEPPLEHWLLPQIEPTSLTHCPSHAVVQQ
jgi:hypothetical protein